MQEFLTLAERQYIVKYELDFLRAQKGQKIPGVPESQGVLKARENICESLLCGCVCACVRLSVSLCIRYSVYLSIFCSLCHYFA